MGVYSKNSGKPPRAASQKLVLPSYKLDSNLVLLPGIIYNVTFSRFKAAALLSRFKDLVSQTSVITNLLNEYEFGSGGGNSSNGHGGADENPFAISKAAERGITDFHQVEVSGKHTPRAKDKQESLNEFDWLVLAISPNIDRIKSSKPSYPEGVSKVATVVRVVGIVDESSNIKISFQAIIRGTVLDNSEGEHHAQVNLRPNEELIAIDWSTDVYDLKSKFNTLRMNFSRLRKSIDDFISNYRQALSNNSLASRGGKLSLQNDPSKDGNAEEEQQKFHQNLLTLNPLANALFLQLTGSKDFSKATQNLQRLYSHFNSGSSLGSGSQAEKIGERDYLRLVDLTAAILPFPNYEKLQLLNKCDVEERAVAINEMMLLLIEIFDNLERNNSFANNWFHKEASNVQKANVVASQLKSIRVLLEGMTSKHRANREKSQSDRGLSSSSQKGANRSAENSQDSASNSEDYDDGDEDGDELRAITKFVTEKLPNISSLSDDSKRLIVKDYKRIKASSNSPGGGNADFHVLRNYLEIVMDIPWDCYVTKFRDDREIDLQSAKEQLDKDHYGLQHVKQRLIQYLVVLKLLGINASKSNNNDNNNDSNSNEKDSNKGVAGEQTEEDAANTSQPIVKNGDETRAAKQRAQSQVRKSIQESKRGINSAPANDVSKNNKSPIIALAGPPGIGKTSIAKSIAMALGRNFQRLSLGGIKDESEIRGHRRTYVGAMPGLIIQALRKARCMNPVILLDEIDKVVGGNSGASKFNGDPSAALLEVLDPEQNNTFIDHYLGFPVDLSQVIFICTANEPYNMTRPLLDRLEMIYMGAYDYNEKLVIGRKYLLPRQIKRNGFPVENNNETDAFVNIQHEAMKRIILDYTREAGVRNFERKLGAICRFKAVEYCENLSDSDRAYNPIVDENDLATYLGVPFAGADLTSSDVATIGDSKVGVVNGLSYNSEGSGSVLVFESIGFDRRVNSGGGDQDGHPGGSGPSLSMTGRLGEVLMESGKIGLTFIKSMIHKSLLKFGGGGADQQRHLLDKFNNLDIHMHVPMGSIPKDGPSAGVTMALSFLSVLLDKPVPTDFAMTGEITLRGLVLPIGGVKEKLMGAHLSSGIRRMIVPRENRKDLIEEYTKSILEQESTEGNGVSLSRMDLNFLNELLRDNEHNDFQMRQVEDYFERKYGIQLNYAREFYDVIKIVWDGDDVLAESPGQKLIEYHM
ncbi:uncharacterized protein LODBEIA_P59330 [Lodderomyces beijingensis]|uniref:Lon protease homolog 2, peroxisomal n=1 Tax=Lodderomyces beijingensis TaxID=1775926 RepID=A0ABP0ZU98_9ASCO